MHHHDRDEHDRPSATERVDDPLGGYLSSARSQRDELAAPEASRDHIESTAGTHDNGNGNGNGTRAVVDALGSTTTEAQPAALDSTTTGADHTGPPPQALDSTTTGADHTGPPPQAVGSARPIRISWNSAAPLQRLVDDLRASIDLAEAVGHDRLVRRGELVPARPATAQRKAIDSAAVAAESGDVADTTAPTGATRSAKPGSATPNATKDRSQNARNLFLVVATLAGLYMVISGLIQAFS